MHDKIYYLDEGIAKERLYIYDTTLRDGQQTQGVHFSADEKIEIAELLSALGVDYIEEVAGANPTDTSFSRTSRPMQILLRLV